MDIILRYKKIILVCVVFLLSVIYVIFSGPPTHFPTGTIVSVEPGESLSTVTGQLKNTGVIYSGFLFRSTVILLGGEKKVIAGDYLLDQKETVFSVALRFVQGNFHLTPIKITIPEGWNVTQINADLQTKIPHFDSQKFLSLAQKQEGYLFPDTYFFSPAVTPERIIEIMKANFNQNIAGVPAVSHFGKPLTDIITMASIVEAEAKTTTDRQIVAGILWKRLSLNMPLQVDSTFLYINGKNTYELTTKDLKIDSPYNTYIHTGLPPTPIDNPGKDSIQATVAPTPSNYLYYFSDKQGTMHYAVTFAEHKKNQLLYGN